MPVPLPVVTSLPGPGASWDTVTVVAALEGLWDCGIGGTPAGLWVAFAVDVGTTAGGRRLPAVVVSVAAVRVDGEVAVGVEAVLADITVVDSCRGCLLVVASGDTVTATVVVVPVVGVVSLGGAVTLGGVVSLVVVVSLGGVVSLAVVVLLAGVVPTGAVALDVGVASELSPVVAVAAGVVTAAAVAVAAGAVAVGALPLTPVGASAVEAVAFVGSTPSQRPQ